MIKGIVTAVPSNIVRNDDEAFVKMTGVAERRIAVEGQTTGTLGYLAASTLMQKMGWNADDIGAIIFVTQTPDVRMPATACKIAGMLGAKCAAFDVNMACSGYVYGLFLAGAISRTSGRAALLLAGDTVSRMCDPADKSTYPLFGDAVSATIVKYSSQFAPIIMGTNGTGFNSLIADPLIRMDGADVMNFALKAVPKLVGDTTMNANVDWYFFHQANSLILRQVIKKSWIEPLKAPLNIGRYGNTSSASIPLLMCDSAATDSLVKRKNRVAMFGFGAGFSFGGCMLDLEPLEVCEVIQQ